ncbi:MAG: hypothetical protein E6R04_01265 [Spirochaetes bacterium]|nr:MAG: hypothetical protein E6R04_01265 [Spirochaetota bacterium]
MKVPCGAFSVAGRGFVFMVDDGLRVIIFKQRKRKLNGREEEDFEGCMGRFGCGPGFGWLVYPWLQG